jgi:hypothetical protein
MGRRSGHLVLGVGKMSRLTERGGYLFRYPPSLSFTPVSFCIEFLCLLLAVFFLLVAFDKRTN